MVATAPNPDEGRGQHFRTLELSVKKSGVASVGALLTSLLVTPLEVAKTRLQAQGPASTIVTANTSTVNYCHCTHFQFSNGLMDHMISKQNSRLFADATTKTFPFACPVHNAPAPVQLRGTLHALSHIVRTEGVSALYAGLPPTLLIAVPSTVFYFTSYDLLHAAAKRQYPDHATLVPFVAGSLARCVAATVVSPLELIRIRMQATANAGSFVAVIRRSVASGIFTLWRGLVPTLARDVPFSAMYWGLFEMVKTHLTALPALQARENSSQTQLGIAFVSGACSGALASVVTQPFDVVKTKQQIETFSSMTEPTKPPKVWRLMREIVQSEGVGGLFTGLSARVAKVAPACAVMISTYEAGKQYMNVDHFGFVLPRAARGEDWMSAEHDPIPAIHGLISRALGPHYLDQIELKVTEKDVRGHDISSFDGHNGRLRVMGSSATAMGFALHKYLKDVVHTQADWDNHALVVPHTLPLPTAPVSIAKNTKFTYYLNVVTTSYSLWTWDWPQWEKHIDWMALQGINLPLAFTGQEKIWLETFKRYNVSTGGMQHFFAGAAFQAWGRMGNIRDSWGPFGPIPLDFIEDQYRLQLRILDRMKEFGMLPALPAFAGHVPAELVELYPHANVRQSSQWAGFPEKFTCVHMLDPTDQLFLDIGRTFIQVQTQLYGGYTSSVYQTDTYNELVPHTSDLAYLRASSKAVIDSMLAADRNAVWIMQGWLFYFMKDFWTNDKIEAYLGGVANDRLIMLDLWTESFPVWSRTSNYFGKPWIYCLLHTFGGNLGLHGNLPKLASDPITSLAASNGQMIGLGLTMEGIFQNYIVYDLALEMAWRSHPMQLDAWIQSYVHQRYHVVNEHALKGWAFLMSSVYRDEGLVGSLATTRPRWHLAVNDTDSDGNLMLPKRLTSSAVHSAWRELILAAADGQLADVDAFQHDLVDVTRQALNNIMVEQYVTLVKLYNSPNVEAAVVCSAANHIMVLLEDMDAILATNSAFLLGRWIRDAKARGTPATAGYFEYQARNQLTRWGVGALNDYANKQWAGLVAQYYGTRWRIWLMAVCDAREAGKPTDDDKIDNQLNDFELKWQTQTDAFPTDPVGNSIEIATTLYAKYGNMYRVELLEVRDTDASLQDL
ncbi:hypothetical protein, variant [Aphanomyces invadans]|uniref:Alpha-N-acetylglucosaminidase n=1 Tax=Aphanomyces invadans TaxID=157072 RepID=A0A024US96_9STRA|nr:hypothetical protein, variant [Aphanomyces invadans]ETW08498.1 hypothetical protein, variant [Aphanomyces invadans]|eukprot:XP_008862303.1 hypothetical protein, variant [Aphanomyces invadans]